MGKGYTVLTIDELTRRADIGGVEQFYRHRIRTTGGTVITVDVDAKDFTPEGVAPILTERAANADKIKSL